MDNSGDNSLDQDWHFAGMADDFEDEDVEQVFVGPLARTSETGH